MSGRQGSFLAYIFVVQQRNILGGSCVLISRPPGCLHLRGKKTRRCKTHLNTNLLSWTVWQATKYMLRHVGYQDLLIKLHNFDKFHAISGPDRAIFDKKSVILDHIRLSGNPKRSNMNQDGQSITNLTGNSFREQNIICWSKVTSIFWLFSLFQTEERDALQSKQTENWIADDNCQLRCCQFPSLVLEFSISLPSL